MHRKKETRGYISNSDEAMLDSYRVYSKWKKPLLLETQLSNFFCLPTIQISQFSAHILSTSTLANKRKTKGGLFSIPDSLCRNWVLWMLRNITGIVKKISDHGQQNRLFGKFLYHLLKMQENSITKWKNQTKCMSVICSMYLTVSLKINDIKMFKQVLRLYLYTRFMNT